MSVKITGRLSPSEFGLVNFKCVIQSGKLVHARFRPKMTMDLIPLCFNWKIVEKHNTIRVPDEAVIAGSQRGKIEC